MAYQNRLYLTLYPGEALVASQLDPAAFARHYLIGSVRHYSGKLIFAEVDPSFRHPYFEKLGETMETLRPHEDGAPKHTKFIASYRVLEHIDFAALRSLYLSTAEAHVLELIRGEHDRAHQPGIIRAYGEIAPISMLVMTYYDIMEYGRYITAPDNPKGAPAMFYTQLELDPEAFLGEFEHNPFAQAPFPFLHPSKLRDAILEMRIKPEKRVKGVSLYFSLEQVSYKLIRHGFVFMSREATAFYPMPGPKEIEQRNFRFWQNM